MSLSARLQTFLQRHYQPLLQSAAILPSVLYLQTNLPLFQSPDLFAVTTTSSTPAGVSPAAVSGTASAPTPAASTLSQKRKINVALPLGIVGGIVLVGSLMILSFCCGRRFRGRRDNYVRVSDADSGTYVFFSRHRIGCWT